MLGPSRVSVLTRIVANVGNMEDIVLSVCEVCSVSDCGPQPECKLLVEVQKALLEGLAP